MKKILSLFLCSWLLTSCQQSFDERCKQRAIEQTANNCPQKIGEGVVMDSLTYDIETKTMSYYYSLDKDHINEESLKKNMSKFRESLLTSIISSVELRSMKEHSVNFCYMYHYSDSDKEVLKVLFTPKDYSK